MGEDSTEKDGEHVLCGIEKYTLTDVMDALTEINYRITRIEDIIGENKSYSKPLINIPSVSESIVENTTTETAITNTNVIRKGNMRIEEVEKEGVIDDILIEMIKQDKNLSDLLKRAKETSQPQSIRLDEIDIGVGARLLVLLIVIGIVYIVRYF